MLGNGSAQLEDALYFSLIKRFIDSELEQYASNLLDRIGNLMLSVALPLLTLWILWRGWEIISARQRDSMMAQVLDLLRVSVVVMLASTAALQHDSLYRLLTDGISDTAVSLVSGKPRGAAASQRRRLAACPRAFLLGARLSAHFLLFTM